MKTNNKCDCIIGVLHDYEIEDWAENNMNWEDVKDFAKKVILPTLKVDYQDGWINGKKEIIIENVVIVNDNSNISMDTVSK